MIKFRHGGANQRSGYSWCWSLQARGKIRKEASFHAGCVESEVDMATALTRARQARLPSPWTGRGILEAGRDPSTSFALLTSLKMTVSADLAGMSAITFTTNY